MSDRQICELCSTSSPANAESCLNCGCSFSLPSVSSASGDSGTGPGPADFGFREADITTKIFHQAEAVFLSSLSSEAAASKLGYRRELVLENADAFYFPVSWIGCAGHLVSKDSLHLISFGSYIGPGLHLWAYDQGISLEPLGKDRRNTFEISSIRDLPNTLRVLKTFLNPAWVDGELSLRIASLPVSLEGVDLYFGIRDLAEARAHEWFTFRVLG